MSFEIQTKEQLEEFACKNWESINKYLCEKMSVESIPIYTSVDIRESKEKFAPVDNNIYPAGFNNLCNLDLDFASDFFKRGIERVKKDANTIGIIPESNTRNTFYLDHLAMLGKTIRDAGYDVYFVSFDTSLFADSKLLELVSHSGFDIKLHQANVSETGEISFEGLTIDLAILNNDQSSPLPVDWDSIKTPTLPTPKIGWFRREKGEHFIEYNKVATEFCNEFNINPDLIQAKFSQIDGVDFSSKEGIEKIASAVDDLKSQIGTEKKVFVKASQGTYGMGITVVSSGEEILSLNRKSRNKMDVGKNKIKFTKVLIQEGVETILKYDEMPAEVTIYLVDGISVGGFMRANKEKGADANLNSKGMVFRKFCISEIRENSDHKAKEAIYSIIARLSTYASSLEIKNILN